MCDVAVVVAFQELQNAKFSSTSRSGDSGTRDSLRRDALGAQPRPRHPGLALATGGDLDDAVEPLNAAVHGLRAAGTDHELPRGLIARATRHRFRGDVAVAEADLAEALDIAERGSMRLHECDAHLEWARLRWSAGDVGGARRHLDAARALVASTGYRRREREAGELARALAGS